MCYKNKDQKHFQENFEEINNNFLNNVLENKKEDLNCNKCKLESILNCKCIETEKMKQLFIQ
jgi:hypothetical protein